MHLPPVHAPPSFVGLVTHEPVLDAQVTLVQGLPSSRQSAVVQQFAFGMQAPLQGFSWLVQVQ
jgi:hypothetical protein